MNLKVLYTDPLFDFFRTKDNSLPAQNESFSEGTFIDNFRFHFNFYNKRANTYWLSSLYAAVQSVYHLTSPEGQDAPVFPDITTGDLPTCLFFYHEFHYIFQIMFSPLLLLIILYLSILSWRFVGLSHCLGRFHHGWVTCLSFLLFMILLLRCTWDLATTERINASAVTSGSVMRIFYLGLLAFHVKSSYSPQRLPPLYLHSKQRKQVRLVRVPPLQVVWSEFFFI